MPRTPHGTDNGTLGKLAGTKGRALTASYRHARWVKAKEGVLEDADTGSILWSRGDDAERPMASLPSVMDRYLVLVPGDLKRKVTIPKGVLKLRREVRRVRDDLGARRGAHRARVLYGLLTRKGRPPRTRWPTGTGQGCAPFIAKRTPREAAGHAPTRHFT